MAAPRSPNRSTDAIVILTEDHDKVKSLFEQFATLHDDHEDEEAALIAKQICQELTIHATVEEEIFYPEIRDELDDEDMLDEAEIEHSVAKELIAQIESMDPSDHQFAARVTVLGEYVNHHIEEEQNEMFPKGKEAEIDMESLGARILARKEELKAERAEEDDDAETEEDEAPVAR